VLERGFNDIHEGTCEIGRTLIEEPKRPGRDKHPVKIDRVRPSKPEKSGKGACFCYK
jgi:hypothetical protein